MEVEPPQNKLVQIIPGFAGKGKKKMKWFKHNCAEKDSEMMALIEAEFGFEGLGRYWRIMEIVCSQMTPEKNWAEFPTKFWQNFLKFSPKKLQNFLKFLSEFSNLTIKFSQKSIRVEIRNPLEIQDEWTRKQGKNSGVTPKPLRTKDKDIDIEKESNNTPLSKSENIIARAREEAGEEVRGEEAPLSCPGGEGGRVAPGVLPSARDEAVLSAPPQPRHQAVDRSGGLPEQAGPSGAGKQAEAGKPAELPGHWQRPGVGEPPPTFAPPGTLSRQTASVPQGTLPPLEFVELRRVWDELARREEPLAGLAEFWRLKREGVWPGLPRILDAVRMLAEQDSQWQRGFAPGLGKFLRLQGWLKEPDLRQRPAMPGGRDGPPHAFRAAAPRTWQEEERENQKIIARMALAGMGVIQHGNAKGDCDPVDALFNCAEA